VTIPSNLLPYRHAILMRELQISGVKLEDLARAWASIDGKLVHFDEGKTKSVWEDKTGHYAGYVVETEEMISRAIKYARARALNSTTERVTPADGDQDEDESA